METQPSKVKGELEAYLFSPKGGIEGLLIRRRRKGAVQITVAPELGGLLPALVAPGERVQLTVGPDPHGEPHRGGEHPVFRLLALKDVDGATHRFDGLAAEETRTVRGKVARLNYARHGEANGVVLDTGDFVHMRPRGFHRVDPRPGQTLEATGRARPALLGGFVIDAESINGEPLDLAPKKKKAKGTKGTRKKKKKKKTSKRQRLNAT